MIFVDAHVHIYNCFDFQIFLDSAITNFKAQATRCGQEKNFTSFLLLTETKSENWFQQLVEYARTGHVIGSKSSKNWSFHCTDENCSLQVIYNASQNLFLIAGRQIVTEEKLEVLALATDKNFKDGAPIEQIIQSVQDIGAIPVIPYGFGKWSGRRGLILSDLLKKAKDSGLFLGDNGGRPKFLPRPSHFNQAEKKGIRILPGSDPLPFSSECKRAGSFGFSIQGSISPKHPAEDLKHILLDPKTSFQTYGRLEKFHRFLINQFAMQLTKRRRNEKGQ